jgi:hypothetical protein
MADSIALPSASPEEQFEQLQTLVTTLQDNAAILQQAVTVAWMVLNACLIFLMQVRLRTEHLLCVPLMLMIRIPTGRHKHVNFKNARVCSTFATGCEVWRHTIRFGRVADHSWH